MIFRHTSKERGMWRGWLKNDQSLEVYWPTSWRRGWSDLSLRVLIHSNDADQGDRMLHLGLIVVGLFLPLGISRRDYTCGDEPSWGLDLSREFGIVFHWGRHRRHFEWPFHLKTLAYNVETPDGWATLMGPYLPRQERQEKSEVHPYRYQLRNGQVQLVEATIVRRQRITGRNILHRIGLTKRTTYELDVWFSGEVGERAGSWKGGCIGCGYTMRPGETPLQTLRRMETERRFE